MISGFLPITRAVYGLSELKIITFGLRPMNFLACNAPIKQLYNLGVESEENSEPDLYETFHKHAGDSLEAARNMGVTPAEATICGGGAKSNLWKTIVANVMNMHIHTVAVEEGPGYGAAILAAVADGCYKNVAQACKKIVRIRETTAPDWQLVKKYQVRYEAFEKLYPALKDHFRDEAQKLY